jgi:hypothetical protein
MGFLTSLNDPLFHFHENLSPDVSDTVMYQKADTHELCDKNVSWQTEGWSVISALRQYDWS